MKVQPFRQGHGTSARYRRHRRDGEQACDACIRRDRNRSTTNQQPTEARETT